MSDPHKFLMIHFRTGYCPAQAVRELLVLVQEKYGRTKKPVCFFTLQKQVESSEVLN